MQFMNNLCVWMPCFVMLVPFSSAAPPPRLTPTEYGPCWQVVSEFQNKTSKQIKPELKL